MLKHLIAFSLRQSSLVLLIAGVLLAYTLVKLPRMPVDVFPELNAPTVVILTEAGGLAADEVEQYVTFPIEASVNGLPGVRRVRSASAISLSLVWVEFDWGTDIYRARQLAAERLAGVRESLPENAHAEITPITSITGEIMLLAVSSPDGSVNDLDLRAYAEFDLRNKLLAVPGVAQVSAIGGELPEYQVNVKQDHLALYGLTIQDVADATRSAHSTASAGYLAEVDRQELPIRQTARVRSVRDIASTIVASKNGSPITLGEVAEVTLGGAPKRGTAANQGLPAVVLTIQKSPGTNTLLLTESIDRSLDQIEGSLPEGITINREVIRQSHFIQRSVDNVVKVLLEATIIVAVILVMFLLNVRTTIITLTALPLSLAVALLTMNWVGLTLNVMTLGGLAVAVGVLVDDAIIDVENVFRRLRENATLTEAERRGRVEVIFDASNEIRPSMVFATLIIVIVFIPLLFLEGIEGRFFAPLGLTYIVSILASLVVALTVTPAMCKLLLKTGATRTARDRPGTSHAHSDGWLVRWLKRRYEPSLRWSLRNRGFVLGAALLATALAALLGRTFGTSFLPEFNEGSFTVFVSSPPGTSLAESNRSAMAIEKRLIEIEGVKSVTRRTGRAERDEHAEPVSNSELDILQEPGADKAKIREAIAAIAGSVPGVTVQIGQPIEHRLSHILSGTPAAVAINVYGEDLPTLRQLAKKIESELRNIPGARDVTANREVLITSLPISYRHPDLAAAGLSPAQAAEQVQTALYGETVAEVNQGVRRFDIVVRLAAEDRQRVDQIKDLILKGRDGMLVRLSEVADIGPEKTSNIIARENAQRKAVISCNVADGYNLGDLVEQVRARVEPIVQREGYIVEFGGQFEAQQSAARTLLLSGGGIALVMLMLLQLSTGSLKVAALVMVNLPLAVIGGVIANFIMDSVLHVGGGGFGGLTRNALALFGLGSTPYQAPVFSIASLVGFITLFGIAVRNGILLVNHYKHVVEVDRKPLAEAIVQGSMERLVPILMTALCAALGLLPLALAAGKPGSELLAPLAVVVLGGLLSSTFLNLIVVPAGYSLVMRANPRGIGPHTESLIGRVARSPGLSRFSRGKPARGPSPD
ncbi:MAG TPA: efflux RND transporter permease subunit [Phycisphaerales bacterium]|nr:efflux RND transporter permease subunit [Phycisphaerales bacterium]